MQGPGALWGAVCTTIAACTTIAVDASKTKYSGVYYSRSHARALECMRVHNVCLDRMYALRGQFVDTCMRPDVGRMSVSVIGARVHPLD